MILDSDDVSCDRCGCNNNESFLTKFNFAGYRVILCHECQEKLEPRLHEFIQEFLYHNYVENYTSEEIIM